MAKWQKMGTEMATLKSKHQTEVESLKDANYASFEEGFDEAIT